MDGTLEHPVPAPASGAAHRDRHCLVEGCPCKDARIVSPRRAQFFAAVARARGETADRIVPADPDWAIPAPAVARPSRHAALGQEA